MDITDDLSLYIRDMYSQQSFEATFDIYDRKVQELGFQGALYAYIPTLYLDEDLPIQPGLHVSKSYNHAFLKHYDEAEFGKNDFIIKEIKNGRETPMDWWKEHKKGVLTQPEQEVIIVAKEDYGISNGLSIPVMNETRGIAGASVISDESQRLYSILRDEKLYQLKMYTHLFHAHVMNCSQKNAVFIEPILATLTNTEKRLLPFIISGQPMKSINIQPQIKHRYGEKCVNSIRRKFGNITKGKLIYYIGVMHLLDYL